MGQGHAEPGAGPQRPEGAGRHPPESSRTRVGRLVQELKKAEADLRDPRPAGREPQEDRRAPRADPKAREEELKKLAKEQAQIQQEMNRQLQKLAKLRADAAAKAEQAAGQMAGPGQTSTRTKANRPRARWRRPSTTSARPSASSQQPSDAEEQLAMEQIAKMADGLKSIAERQEKMVDETDSLRGDPRKKNDGKSRSPGGPASTNSAGSRSGSGRGRRADRPPRRGRARLRPDPQAARRRRWTTPPTGCKPARPTKATIDAQELTPAGFQQLIDSLKPEKGKDGRRAANGEREARAGAGQPTEGSGDGIPPTAQIKMLRTLQQELNERTDFFDNLLRRQKKLNPEQAAELDKLHEDQGTLADLITTWTRPKKDDGED